MTPNRKDNVSRTRARNTLCLSSTSAPTLPNGKPTPEFPQLWQSLPTELKVSVLSHKLISSTGIKSYRIIHEYDVDYRRYRRVEHLSTYEKRVTLDQELVFYCLVFPELAQMLHRAYYTQNVFIVRLMLNHGRKPSFLLPPLHIRSLIREMRWETTLSKYNWEYTLHFAAGKFGFEKLQFVTVYVMWPWFIDCYANESLKPENWGERQKVVFGCKGKLVFQDDKFKEENVRITLAHVGTTREAIKKWIGGLVQFAG